MKTINVDELLKFMDSVCCDDGQVYDKLLREKINILASQECSDEFGRLTFQEISNFVEPYPDYTILDVCHKDPVISWRGAYCKPSLNFVSENKFLKVKDFLKEIHKMKKGKTYYGYKGGDYSYDMDDEPYMTSWGSSLEQAPVTVKFNHDSKEIKFICDEFPY